MPDSCVASLSFGCCLNYSVASRISPHAAALQKGLQKPELVLTTRGTSMGLNDLLKSIIERHIEDVVPQYWSGDFLCFCCSCIENNGRMA